jgi:hypothetical protein
MRKDTAEILTRLFFVERSLILSQAGWIPGVVSLEGKAALARMLWEDSVAADAIRNRILELRYPSRVVVPDQHQVVLDFFDEARNAPGPEAFVLSLARVLKPALRDGYETFSKLSDRISDGPSALVLKHALNDKNEQISDLEKLADGMLAANPGRRQEAEIWVGEFSRRLTLLGGHLLDIQAGQGAESIQLPGRCPFELARIPARDSRFKQVRFYWPHIVEPDFPSDTGIPLQLRSAIGHLNEVWAAEMSAANLYNFADELGWEYVRDIARWTYDESRHCLMGYHRLVEWGFRPEELPLGDYIYTTARGQDPIFGIGMLFYFETKYIHRGQQRIKAFTELEDSTSRHDYEFDWADETFHAEYGKRWLTALFEKREKGPHTLDKIRDQCDKLIAATIATATPREKAEIHAQAERLIKQAEAIVTISYNQHTTIDN